jgi:hypothetical protein
MYKRNKENEKAIAAWQKYLELNKGKDADGGKRIEEEMTSIGGTPVKAPAKTPKKPAPKKK